MWLTTKKPHKSRNSTTVKLNVTMVKQGKHFFNHGNCQFTKNQGQLKTFDSLQHIF